jgi:hypothetical protein
MSSSRLDLGELKAVLNVYIETYSAYITALGLTLVSLVSQLGSTHPIS